MKWGEQFREAEALGTVLNQEFNPLGIVVVSMPSMKPGCDVRVQIHKGGAQPSTQRPEEIAASVTRSIFDRRPNSHPDVVLV